MRQNALDRFLSYLKFDAHELYFVRFPLPPTPLIQRRSSVQDPKN